MTHLPVDGVVVGQHPLVSRLMKGIFHQRPPQPRYQATWSVGTLLTHLQSLGGNSALSLKQLTGKLACLLALCAANRGAELQGLDARHMVIQPDGVTFLLPVLTKTQRPGQQCQEFSYPALPPDSATVCPVRCLETYLERTGPWRTLPQSAGGGQDARPDPLFRALIRPHGGVSRDTISRWIRTTLDDAGIDTAVFKAHSTRSAATTSATQSGVTLADVLATARWSKATTFERYYYRPTSTAGHRFGLSVLGSES